MHEPLRGTGGPDVAFTSAVGNSTLNSPRRRRHFPLLVDPQLAAIEFTMERTVARGRSMIGTPVSHEPQPVPFSASTSPMNSA